jgi:hypothetical protein
MVARQEGLEPLTRLEVLRSIFTACTCSSLFLTVACIFPWFALAIILISTRPSLPHRTKIAASQGIGPYLCIKVRLLE